MPTIKKSALVHHSAEQMFALVNEIESYPLFLPWCKSAVVLSRTEDEVRAQLELSKGAVHKSFTTVNRLQKNKMIEVRLVEGPFHHLQGFWRFDSLSEEASKVSLDLEFEFTNRMVGLVIGPVFNPIANTMVEAFCRRADEMYR